MSPERSSDPKRAVVGVLAAFAAIGVFGAGQTGDGGVAVKLAESD